MSTPLILVICLIQLVSWVICTKEEIVRLGEVTTPNSRVSGPSQELIYRDFLATFDDPPASLDLGQDASSLNLPHDQIENLEETLPVATSYLLPGLARLPPESYRDDVPHWLQRAQKSPRLRREYDATSSVQPNAWRAVPVYEHIPIPTFPIGTYRPVKQKHLEFSDEYKLVFLLSGFRKNTGQRSLAMNAQLLDLRPTTPSPVQIINGSPYTRKFLLEAKEIFERFNEGTPNGGTGSTLTFIEAEILKLADGNDLRLNEGEVRSSTKEARLLKNLFPESKNEIERQKLLRERLTTYETPTQAIVQSIRFIESILTRETLQQSEKALHQIAIYLDHSRYGRERHMSNEGMLRRFAAVLAHAMSLAKIINTVVRHKIELNLRELAESQRTALSHFLKVFEDLISYDQKPLIGKLTRGRVKLIRPVPEELQSLNRYVLICRDAKRPVAAWELLESYIKQHRPELDPILNRRRRVSCGFKTFFNQLAGATHLYQLKGEHFDPLWPPYPE